MDKPYVGFWWRVIAALIDGVILSVVIGIVMTIFGVSLFSGGASPEAAISAMGLFQLLGLIIVVTYDGVMQASSLQATLGKLAIGAIVTDKNGERLSYGKSFLRAICKIPSQMILFIGYLMVAFTARKQGLHDIMAGTLVLKKSMAHEMAGASA